MQWLVFRKNSGGVVPKVIAVHFVECTDLAQYLHLVYEGLGIYFQLILATRLAGTVGKVPGGLNHASHTAKILLVRIIIAILPHHIFEIFALF